MGLHRRVDVAERADRAAELADRHSVAGGAQAAAVAVHLQGPQRDLGAERGGLGVDAVGAADHHRVAVLAGQAHQGGQQPVRGLQQQVAGVAQHPAPGGVHHIGGRQPVVDPRARGLADGRLYDVHERSHVVVGDLLPVLHGAHERVVHHGGGGAAAGGVRRRHHAECNVRLGRQQLDLQVAAEAGRVAEDSGHLRHRVAGDHRRPPLTTR